MPLPEFIPSISSEMRQAIDVAIAAIEAEDNVRILFAIESGSRAWGFPSPDSDYDVRFVYARPLDWYLSLDPGRDVIERPINDDLDIGGWDLQKALKLLLKPNPVLLEWLTSPIRYRWNESECNRLIALSDEAFHSSPSLYHYLNLGEGQIKLHRDGKERVKLKSYFYMLRPAFAIRWMRLHPGSVPPMNLQDLSAGLDLPPEIEATVAELIERKAGMVERQPIEPIGILDSFIREEFDWARQVEKAKSQNNLKDEANRLFRDLIGANG